MPKPLLPDDLWEVIEPLLPVRPPRPKGGRPPIDDRRALTGILFVLKTGLAWRDLPTELGWGSGVSCWRRLRDWYHAGVWDAVHLVLLNRLSAAERIDWERAAVDGAAVAAPKGGSKRGQTRRIEGSGAANTMSWSTLKAYHSRRRSRRQTRMIPR